jgi:uncharacterized protein
MPTSRKPGRQRSRSPRRNVELARAKRILRKHLSELHERYSVKSLGVFGSFVRGEQKKHSDLDLLVEYAAPVSLFDCVGLQDHLSDLLGVKVDLVPRQNLRPRIGKRILADVVWLQLDGKPVTMTQLQNERQGRVAQMKRKREFLDFMEDIVKAMDQVERYVAGLTLDQLRDDELRSDALCKTIEIIGEATKHIPADVRKRYPDIPWRDMAGMRDVLVHGYFQIDYAELWKAATVSVPNAQPLVAEALAIELERERRDEENTGRS